MVSNFSAQCQRAADGCLASSENVDFKTPYNVSVKDSTARLYRRAYYAAVAFADYNIGNARI